MPQADTRNLDECPEDGPVPASPPKGGTPVVIDDMTLMTTTVVIPPCQPCIAINGTVDPYAFVAIIDDTPQVLNLSGPVTGTVTYLDPCDPACTPPICEPEPPECVDPEEPCDCDSGCPDCDPAALAATAGGIL